jgi:hypothetical protein
VFEHLAPDADHEYVMIDSTIGEPTSTVRGLKKAAKTRRSDVHAGG